MPEVPFDEIPGVVVGGLRQRLIHDSVFNEIKNSLSVLGWFDSGRQHKSINIQPGAVDFDEKITPNMIVVSTESDEDSEVELGSELIENRSIYYVDVLAENDAIGQHLSGDIRAILRGRFPDIGRARPVIQVYDYRVSPSPELFYVDIENVTVDRARVYRQPWHQFWFMIKFDVVDNED